MWTDYSGFSVEGAVGVQGRCMEDLGRIWQATMVWLPSGTGTSLRRNRPTLGPYSRPMPRALWLSLGGGLLLMSELTL